MTAAFISQLAKTIVGKAGDKVLDEGGELSDLTFQLINELVAASSAVSLSTIIWDSGDIDGDLHSNGEIDHWTNDPKVMVRRIAGICLQQAVLNELVRQA